MPGILDGWLVPFIAQNPVSIVLILGILKIIAKEAHWATGNKIIELFTGLLPGKRD